MTSLLLAWSLSLGSLASHAPCVPHVDPTMVCIEGGPAIVGADDDAVAEKNRHSVELSTFYLDKHEITFADYQRCVDGGACTPVPAAARKAARSELEPVTPLSYVQAERYCTFAGKRLPTEFEWEKAARGSDGELYPWGNDAPSCARGHSRACAPAGCATSSSLCAQHRPVEVSSLPAQRYGLVGMGGNAFEWTSTWASASHRTCGARCEGIDPQGPCDGAPGCATTNKKTLKGGSFFWPVGWMRGSARRAELADGTYAPRVSSRCATSHPYLTRFPSRTTKARAAPPALAAPSADDVRTAHNVATDSLKKPVCDARGRSFADCRDPAHYVVSNEPRALLWRPYVENLGGGYVGVGIDQNYSLMSLARSEWAWLFDYDPTIVRLHWVLRAFVLAADTPAAFVDAFAPSARAVGRELLRKTYASSPDVNAYVEIYGLAAERLHSYFKQQAAHKHAVPDITRVPGRAEDAPRRVASVKIGDPLGDDSFGWLATQEHYNHIRTMFVHDRIVLLEGDMLANKTMVGIGAAATAMKVPVRIYYASNAPEAWPLSAQYKRNVLSLPFDEQSVALQTLSGLKSGFGQRGYWHHHVQAGLHQQQLLRTRGIHSLRHLAHWRVKTNDGDLTTAGLPSD
jgi:formylglycine-generating enzyme required for sulfatase activity